ncbi:MAG: OmpH family outer membrane protein [Oligoflexales bacterium]|nr:OmpH family outer membrane protein [Oligoflexales bacterium]
MIFKFQTSSVTRARLSFVVFAGIALQSHALKAAEVYGVVDMQKVILTVEEGKTARGALETEIKTKEKDLMAKKTELDGMNQNWQKQAALLSEDARMKKQKEFQDKFLELRKSEMDFQNEIKQKEQQATQKIAIKVAGLVDRIAKEKKLTAVFETSSSGLIYLKDPIDLTDQVIKDYNSQSQTAKKDQK